MLSRLRLFTGWNKKYLTRIINVKKDFKIDRSIIKYLWIILILLFIDQLIKIIVYKTFLPHEESKLIGEWFRIRLELNDGTAFSYPFQNETDRYLKIFIKVLLSIVCFICLVYFLNKRSPKILLIGLALCVSGMIGNLIDRVFHGIILNNSLGTYSTRWFHGQIIDMFYFSIIEPVFNLADLILLIGGVISFIGLLKISRLSHIERNNLRLP
jgi:signal peptidase II